MDKDTTKNPLFLIVINALVFFLLAPVVVSGFVPYFLSGWDYKEAFLSLSFFRLLGFVMLFIGIIFVLQTFTEFVRKSGGTPAPFMPSEKLVLSGLYKYVRNPMYYGVLLVIYGQALLLGSYPVLLYALAVSAVFHFYVVKYEEPQLKEKFGKQYENYCKYVNRWMPHTKPWNEK